MRYTYVLEDLSNLDMLWNNFQKNIRTDSRKAQKSLVVRSDLPLQDFISLNKKTFLRQGKTPSYSVDVVERIDAACGAHDCRKIFFAQDAQGRLHAAVYLVWDENSAYYLMGGGDSELRNSGATSLCMWEAIQFAGTVTKKFDFEGSMREPVERFFRAFGAAQKPYFSVTKINTKPLKIWKDISSWMR